MRYLPIITAIFAGMLSQCTVKTTVTEEPAPPATPTYPDSGSFCAGRAKAECGDAVIAACAAPTKDRCVANRQTACVTGLPAGKTYDATKAEACVNSVAGAYADAKLTKDEIAAYTATCALVFDGTAIAGAACQSDADCKLSAGLRCVPGAASTTGTCQVPKTVSGGGRCNAADAMCEPGYHCGSTQYCQVDADYTEPCSAVVPCNSAFKCSTGGTCEKRLSDGTACTSNGDCISDICETGLNMCVSQITLAPTEPFCVAVRQ
jgi:hypothetical protein